MLQNGFFDVPPGKVATVVTHLEMRAPQRRGTPLPEGLAFASLPRDTDIYRGLFRRIGQPWLWFGRLRMPDEELQAILDDARVHLFTLLKDGTPEALLELDFRVAGACELAYFGLSDALIGQGAGSYLMDQAVDRAFDQEITRFHVHTCTLDSPQALGFYRRCGFVPVRQQIEIADDPRVIGLLPESAGPHVPLFRG